MSSNIPDWVQQSLVAGREQKIAQGRLMPGKRAPLTQREQAFLQEQAAKEKAPRLGEAVVFDALDKLNSTVGRKAR